MLLSDISVKRPIFAMVISLLLVTVGALSFSKLPLREYPDISPPVVSISTVYPGASAEIVESKITQLIENRVSGIEGIVNISSTSRDGASSISIEFSLNRDIDAAANDVRDRVSRLVGNLPTEVQAPEISKVDANNDVILWLNLTSSTMNQLELTDYAERYLLDKLAVLEGVARIRLGGERRYAMRIWLNRQALAARQLTVQEIEEALRRENIELPAGRIESETREFTIRVARAYNNAADFAQLVIKRGDDGAFVRLSDVARVIIEAADTRSELRSNGEAMVGLGVIKQSTANTLAVTTAVKAEVERIKPTLPAGTDIARSYDASVFIESAIHEVYVTLFITVLLVIAIIYLFLGSLRVALIPAVTVPVSLISGFIILYALNLSINLLTLLALVLAIGLVVDDAIVVLENVYRRIEEGEPPLLAAYYGTRQVGFAVIATTLVLVAVFLPIAFLEGLTGRLFSEFALTIAASVAFSSVIALTLTPMMCTKLLRHEVKKNKFQQFIDTTFHLLEKFYRATLIINLRFPALILLSLVGIGIGIYWLINHIPQELAPREDRGVFFIQATAPEGTSFEFMNNYMKGVETELLKLVQNGEARRLQVRVPGFGSVETVNTGIAIVVLDDWHKRRPAQIIIDELRGKLAQFPAARTVTIMRQGLSGGNTPVQFVIGGGTYAELAQWRDIVLEKTAQSPILTGVNVDYRETNPQLMVEIDKNRAADLGVSLKTIGSTLETLLGSRKVTTYLDRGQEYDVILEGEKAVQRTPNDLTNIYVRSERTGQLISLANLVTLKEGAGSNQLNRYNRIRAITISANLNKNYSLSEGLNFLEDVVKTHLPSTAYIDYKGESLEFKKGGKDSLFLFGITLLLIFLVLAAQFESFIHPSVIMLTVPLAIGGALLGLFLTNQTLNIYSQIGIIMLVGLAAKNGILIVEFANQLRDEGQNIYDALLAASILRLRPIIMTSVTTLMGAVPLIFATGAGAENRFVLGVVIFTGMLAATIFTIYVIPTAYILVARFTRSPNAVARELALLETKTNK